MFFSDNEISVTLLGVFKLKRKSSTHESVPRLYDAISFRSYGSSIFKSGSKTYRLNPGDILYIPQLSDYTQSTKDETVIAVHFINHNPSNNKSLQIISTNKYEEFNGLLTAMYQLWNEKKPGYQMECTSMLYHLFYLIRQEIHDDIFHSVSTNDSITKAIDYIHKNYRKENILISDLAKMSAVSEVYFRRLFKKIYLMSPNKYINSLRLEYAAQLLQSKLYSVNEVSEKSGYSNVKYFERLFKQKYNLTPKEYKNIDIEETL